MYAKSSRLLAPAHSESLQAQNFPAHKPRDLRIPSAQAMTHVAWSCDGKRLAAVGIDKVTRVWAPETSVSLRACHHRPSLAHTDFRWSTELQRISLEAIPTT